MPMNSSLVSIEEMKAAAADILGALHKVGEACAYKKAVVAGLSGDLGSGKTTFSQFMAGHLGVTEQVTSPTFIIEKIYKTSDAGKFETLVHIDAYRIEKAEEINSIKFNELLEMPNTLVLVEWPEKIEGAMPEGSMNIRFEFQDEKTRKISY